MGNSAITQPPEDSREKKQPRPAIAVVASVLLFVAVLLCYCSQPDWLAPIALVPPWCWLIPGAALALFGRSRRRHHIAAVLTLWAAFIMLFCDEPRSLLSFKSWPTTKWLAARKHGRGIRVISLNCNVGQSKSVQEVAVWKPDIVLLQESPGDDELGHLSRALFGADGIHLYGGDVSILARSKLQPKLASDRSYFIHAEIDLPTGGRANIVSLRLAPPVERLDFWNPAFWTEHHDKRLEHRQQIHDLMRQIERDRTSNHWIVGGDFNAPPYDGALAPLRTQLFDTFRQAGRGWGPTGTNEFPLFRVDQIWVSQGFRIESVKAIKTVHSDHRMVVCDLIIDE